ncbi:MAG: hypothetical protein HYS12_14390 [Planctomycetes bacterium]|nr:hypothetical protein [Planctomycetota bacterium]
MRKILLGLGLSALLLSTGCSGIQGNRTGGGQAVGKVRAPQPNAVAMVSYLNENAQRMQGLTFTSVSMRASQDGNVGSIDGRLDCQRPRNFRLTGKAVGQPMVDIGSNGEEFWYWISKANPPYVYHCSYTDLARPDIIIPFPFQPDMILAALGMAQYDQSRPYEVRVNNAARTVELIEPTRSPQGQPLQKITVFRSGPVRADEPIVIAHILRDAQGKDICKATITHAQTDPATRVVVPRRVQLVWPMEKIELTMKLEGLHVNAIDAQRSASLFNRGNLSRQKSFDLARREVDGGVSELERVGIPPR